MERPLLTVIMPVYNAEKYVAEAIDSVISQTYQNWELIIVNDASTDNSQQIIKGYSEKDKRIEVVNLTERVSIGLVRNEGLKRIKGEYVAWIDADDIYHPRHLDYLLKEIIEKKLDFIDSQITDFKEDLHFENIFLSEILNYDIIDGESFMKGWFKKKYQTSLCTKLFKQKLFNNFKFPDITLCEESFFYYENFKNFERIGKLNYSLYGYRKHGSSSTKSISKENVKTNIKLYDYFFSQSQVFPDEHKLIKQEIIEKLFFLWKKSIYKGLDLTTIRIIEQNILKFKGRSYFPKSITSKEKLAFNLRKLPFYYRLWKIFVDIKGKI